MSANNIVVNGQNAKCCDTADITVTHFLESGGPIRDSSGSVLQTHQVSHVNHSKIQNLESRRTLPLAGMVTMPPSRSICFSPFYLNSSLLAFWLIMSVTRGLSWVLKKPVSSGIQARRQSAVRFLNFGGCRYRRLFATSSPNDFHTHVFVEPENLPATVSEVIAATMGDLVASENEDVVINKHDNKDTNTAGGKLTPKQLLQLGSVWFLSADHVKHNSTIESSMETHSKFKASRLELADADRPVQEGDYFRIHHNPRRFFSVYDVDWKLIERGNPKIGPPSVRANVTVVTTQGKEPVVGGNSGFWIINKPPLVPVHATVDNRIENVVHQISRNNPSPEVEYVATTQRLDINTSGLLVVATKPEFAAYFADLLRNKTRTATSKSNTTDTQKVQPACSNIKKSYKCLVCLQQREDESVVEAWQRLKGLQEGNETIRHFLEPSIRAPKTFAVHPPRRRDADGNEVSDWLECLMTIRQVGPLVPIHLGGADGGGSAASSSSMLSERLWSSANGVKMPHQTKAICELKVDLQTGRAHQIRGQLAEMGYPLVGDEQYGGAIPAEGLAVNEDNVIDGRDAHPQLLALQCHHVGFWDADYKMVWNHRRRRDIIKGFPSDRWVSASLEKAWWTDILLSNSVAGTNETFAFVTSAEDIGLLTNQKEQISLTHDKGNVQDRRPDLLPPVIQLSPGRNKYVLVKLVTSNSEYQGSVSTISAGADPDADTTTRWYVKSASPNECGGPYHANVAQDLLDWIIAAGYNNDEIQVAGGGKIDYNPATRRAHVYGFSYGYGKGNHAKVASLIQAETGEGKPLDGIHATYDNSDDLY